MKSIAIFLFVIFAGTILTPVATSLCKKEKVTLFIVDEEKSTNNQIPEVKETKKFTNYLFMVPNSIISTGLTSVASIHSKTSLPTSPVLEFIAPPPNFCC